MRLDSLFEKISRQFESGEKFSQELAELKTDIEMQRQQFRESGVWRSADPKDVEQLVLLSATMDSLLESLGQISDEIGEINQQVPENRPLLETKNAES